MEVEKLVGHECVGLLPPAWQCGPLADPASWPSGLSYRIGLRQLLTRDGHSIPLATWSWDLGPVAARVAPVGWLAEAAGRWLRRQHGAVPCVAIHPLDVPRGHLPAALRLIDRLLGEGRRPATYRHLLEVDR
jgi:hypothetical protein